MFLSLRSISVILSAAVFFVQTTTATPRIGVVAFWCGPILMDLGTRRSEVVYEVMEELKSDTARNNRNHWVRKSYLGPDGLETCFGHSTCDHRISAEDCTDCLRAAKVKIFVQCGFKTAATMRLEDCYMKYGFETFDN